ncbi:cupin domain-containing protein [Patescibacteria group bacterium]|nr:cupin domain-containing protein [Patescibacteria group bacterium]
MKIIKKNQAEVHKNSDACVAIEYPLDDKDINGAVIELNGRYPDKGRVVNSKCKEIAYVIKGTGKVIVEGQEIKFKGEDLILIELGEKYHWEGNFIMFVSCAPAWYPEQHKEVE